MNGTANLQALETQKGYHMAVSNDFLGYVLDQYSAWGGVSVEECLEAQDCFVTARCLVLSLTMSSI